jgi:hypothetical protein
MLFPVLGDVVVSVQRTLTSTPDLTSLLTQKRHRSLSAVTGSEAPPYARGVLRLADGTEVLAVDSTACWDYTDGKLVFQSDGKPARVVRFLLVFSTEMTLPGGVCESGDRGPVTTRYALFSPIAVAALPDETLAMVDSLSGLTLRIRSDGSTESGLLGSRLFPIDEDTYRRLFVEPRLRSGEWHPVGSRQLEKHISRYIEDWRRVRGVPGD